MPVRSPPMTALHHKFDVQIKSPATPFSGDATQRIFKRMYACKIHPYWSPFTMTQVYRTASTFKVGAIAGRCHEYMTMHNVHQKCTSTSAIKDKV